jgi:hypothetical protein
MTPLHLKHNVIHIYLPCANSDRYIFSIVSIDDNKEVALISERDGFVPVKEWTGIVGTDDDEVLPFVAYDRFALYVKDAQDYVNSVSEKHIYQMLSEQSAEEE